MAKRDENCWELRLCAPHHSVETSANRNWTWLKFWEYRCYFAARDQGRNRKSIADRFQPKSANEQTTLQEVNYCARSELLRRKWTTVQLQTCKSRRQCLCCCDPLRKLSLATPTAQPAVHVEHEVILIDLGLAQSVNLFTECAVSSDYKLMMWSDARPLMPFISNDLADWVMKNNNNNSDWCTELRQERSAQDKTRALPFSQMVCSAF